MMHVQKSTKPNAYSTKVSVAINWNLHLLSNPITTTSDREVFMFLTCGWPISHDGITPTKTTTRNHGSAMKFKQHITKYICKELAHHTLVGPLVTLPVLNKPAVSPMSTHEKKALRERGILVDKSWPGFRSVNDGIQCDRYLEQTITLRYPTVDDLCKRAKQLDPRCVGYKKDMAHAFRQILMDPADWSSLGLYWEGTYFLDKATVMGFHTAP